MREFEDARDKVLMGAERRSLSMTDQERKNTAYHEAGHAIVGLNMKGSLPIHKATIIPRGRALGMVQYMPERDQISQSREEMIARMAMAMGGRAAEEIKFGYDKVTSGASSDIEAHETALKILKKKKKDWTTLAEALLEYETLSGDEITVLLSDGIKPKRTDGKFGTKPAVPAVPSTKKGSIGSPQPES